MEAAILGAPPLLTPDPWPRHDPVGSGPGPAPSGPAPCVREWRRLCVGMRTGHSRPLPRLRMRRRVSFLASGVSPGRFFVFVFFLF